MVSIGVKKYHLITGCLLLVKKRGAAFSHPLRVSLGSRVSEKLPRQLLDLRDPIVYVLHSDWAELCKKQICQVFARLFEKSTKEKTPCGLIRLSRIPQGASERAVTRATRPRKEHFLQPAKFPKHSFGKEGRSSQVVEALAHDC